MKKISFYLGLLTIFSTSTIAQTCNINIESSHLEQQYIDNSDGTITDVVNGLMWAKCSLGETFNNTNCDGEATSYDTWTEALLAAKTNENYIGDANDWRLPNIKELGSLVERACVAPAIDLALFPETPELAYWSNTFDSSDINNSIKGLIIDFYDGSEILNLSKDKKLIRLVRTLPTP